MSVGITKSTLIITLLIIVASAGSIGYWYAQLPAGEVTRSTQFPFTVKDDLGRNITLASAPLKVLSVVPSNTEIVFAIGGESKLVGVDRYSKFPPKLEQLKREGRITEVGGGFDPDMEKIVSLQPDLILGNGPSQRKALQKLEDLGFRIMYLRPNTLSQLYQNVRLIGEVLDLRGNAEDLVGRMQQRVQAVLDKVKNLPQPKVYMEVWNDPLMSIGRGTLPDDLVSLAGGINLFHDSPERGRSPVVSPEAILNKNPDVIILVHTGNTPEEVKARPGWSLMKAVRENRVHAVDGILVAPTPRAIDGLEQIARILHPAAFG